jgi:RimJ/RimL family protein N-acetyltransferase
MTTTVGALPEILVAHLTNWTGGWPPAIPATITGNPRNALPTALDRPDHVVYAGTFRWTTAPAPLADVGEWIEANDPVVPDWLRPFGGRVLIARDADGNYVAGVGIKRHDANGHELSVGTEPAARGRGLARRLVAQAARALLDDGIVATYLHDPANVASARVAEAAGFPDLGWRVLGMFAPAEFDDNTLGEA